MSGEEGWTAIQGWEEFYEASPQGLIRSRDRVLTTSHGRTRHLRGRVLKPRGKGHYYVSLKANGVHEQVLIHRLVAKTFIPNPENLPHVLHWDDNPQNNSVTNLRWGTDLENRRDALRNGRQNGGILSDDNVREIRELYSQGFNQKTLAEEYGVTQSTISGINIGRTRANV